MYEAARVGDSIVHTSALAGFIAGAIIGVAVVAAASFVVCSGGIGAFILGTALSMGGTAIPALGEWIGKQFTSKTGAIDTGSKIVHTNKKEAAYTGTIENNPEGMQTAKGSEVICSKHPSTPKPQVAEGSTLVFIDSRPAARKEDRVECGAKIDEGSENVHMGKEKYEYLPVQDEVPAWLRKVVDVAMFVAGFASGIKNIIQGGLKKCLPCVGKIIASEAASWAIGEGVSYLIGGPVDATTGRKVLPSSNEVDFALPGHLPIIWSRFYASDLKHNSILGQGWILPFEQHLYIEDNKLNYCDKQGRILTFELLEPGQKVFVQSEQKFIICTDTNHYAIQTIDNEFYYFGEVLENNQPSYLQRIEDKFGHYIHLTYEANKLTDITATGGHRIHLHYRHPKGKVTEVVRVVNNEAVETLVQYRYDNNGQLTAVINRNGDTTRHFNYKNNLMVSHQNGLGFICNYKWQEIGEELRVIEHWTNDGEHYYFKYDLENHLTIITDALKRQCEIRYNDSHFMTYCRTFGGEIHQLEWDESENLIAYLMPTGKKVQLCYDDLSRLTEEIDPIGRKVSYQYHQQTNLKTKVIYPDGSIWQVNYDDKGAIVDEIDPLGNVTKYYNTGDGLPYAVVDALEKRKTILWNEQAQVQCYTDCSNKTTRYHYNEYCHLSTITNALGEKVKLERKPAGEIISLVHADGIKETFTHNAMGQLLSHADGKGQTTYLSRNPRGLLIKKFDPKDQTIIYQYDIAQRLIALLNENNEAYRFSYDESDRLIEEVSIDQLTTRYTYNALGFLSQITEIGIDKNLKRLERDSYFQQDEIGRLLLETNEDAQYRYQYDALDRLIAIDSIPTAKGVEKGIVKESLTFSYNSLGQLIEENTTQGKLHYIYDLLGNLTSLTLPDGRKINHFYYGSGHLHQISLDNQLISDFERDDLHREILRTQGNLTSRFGYDAQGRKQWQFASHRSQQELTTLNKKQTPIDRLLSSRENLIYRQYNYDPAGELISLLDKARGKIEYNYDKNGQLKTVTTRNRQEQFIADAAGNFLPSQVLPSKYFAKHNRITDYGHIHIKYDEWGNVTEKTIGLNKYQKFSYDCENRLVKSQTFQNDQLINEGRYYYDSLGRRIRKTVDNLQIKQKKQTTFLWQGLRLLAEQTEQLKQLYIYEADSYAPLARLDTMSNGATDIYYYHTDQIGTPLELTNQQGTIVWQANYKAWGEIESCSINEIDQNLRYQGQYFDEETELHYNTFRYYDPQIGRFTTQDPLGLDGGFNLYQYAPNAFGYSDPLGLLRRPYIRKSTRQTIEARGRTKGGRFLDSSTGKPISGGKRRSYSRAEGQYDIGHKPGHEHWREVQKAEAEGLTQKQFNDRMNNPDLYQIEDPMENQSHRHEDKGGRKPSSGDKKSRGSKSDC